VSTLDEKWMFLEFLDLIKERKMILCREGGIEAVVCQKTGMSREIGDLVSPLTSRVTFSARQVG